ncbi:tripartite tricarboxylate transporter permease [Streptomyces thinghirensis]|nr:tripartite tricarboxylate transporter permease [Streptomyces thinghirensis]
MAGPESAAIGLGGGHAGVHADPGPADDAVAAVMLAAFQQYGIQPGPLLFEREPELVWGPDRVPLRRHGAAARAQPAAGTGVGQAAAHPRPYLYAGIMFFAAVGAYAVGGEVVDLVILLIIGLVGFGMRRYGLPILPAVIGVILGPNAEQQLRRALQISDGSVTGLVNTPFAVTGVRGDRAAAGVAAAEAAGDPGTGPGGRLILSPGNSADLAVGQPAARGRPLPGRPRAAFLREHRVEGHPGGEA